MSTRNPTSARKSNAVRSSTGPRLVVVPRDLMASDVSSAELTSEATQELIAMEEAVAQLSEVSRFLSEASSSPKASKGSSTMPFLPSGG